jgi:hypothetical protein
MPEIKRFGSFKLLMFFQEENPPHMHIVPLRSRDYAAKIRISNGDVLAGAAPAKVLREARAWVAENREEMLKLWDEFQL